MDKTIQKDPAGKYLSKASNKDNKIASIKVFGCLCYSIWLVISLD